MQDTLLSLQHISKNFGEGDVLRDISLDVARGEFVTLLGASGCGKTTTLRIISGLETPDEGTVLLDGRDVTALPPERRPVNTVFQSYALFPHMNVEKNVAYGLRVRRMDKASIEKRVREMLELVQMADFAKRMPSQLSGGQRQRIAIARALAPEPELLLLDEPLASLDIPRKRELLPYLQRLAREINIPMLYVSHSLDEIQHLADKVLVLEEGKVKAFGDLEAVWSSSIMHPWLPQDQQSTILNVTIAAQHPQYAMTALALGDQQIWVNQLDRPQGEAARIRIQASDVSLVLQPGQQTSIRNILPAQVMQCIESNGQVEVRLEISGRTLWARISPWARDDLGITPGQRLYAQIKSVSIAA